ncbi:uncharacterized protein GGS22DRAFT_153035 [Annulohypoxylon maeteangense]|uniref:uncharacterized protein n=1 Tax=Annulohypoxylon maeteangense TaxID=1927788 RepID=UPI00200895D0|nr:uncharacterized protein GGS22DRAFT_153035 [Annulohypoxylon maeteangense]KAI0889061.1 hypothetical protein GGS22DRAFT_153035 [Annulohypoxylon maeteangense]
MAKDENRRKLDDWRVIQHRGRHKVLKASKDPVARAKFISEMPSPRPVILHISEADRTSALASLPAFLFRSPAIEPDPRRNSHQPYYSFLTSFPPEIRNVIYQYAIDYPSCRNLYDYYYDQREKAISKIELRPRSTNPRLSHSSKFILRTPTILLLCKQITREALSLLYLQPFVIDRIPPWIMGHPAPLSLLNFISQSTLQNLRFVQIKIPLGENAYVRSGKVWLEFLHDVLNAWSERNSLIRLQIMFKISNVTGRNLWSYELEDYEKLLEKLSYFEFKHGLKPGLIRWEHWVIDLAYAYKVGFRNPVVRVHPDPYIWQGSVIEWL